MVLVERRSLRLRRRILGRTVCRSSSTSPNVVKQATLVYCFRPRPWRSALLLAGSQRPFATWGRIISDGQDYITAAWWLVTCPASDRLVVGRNLLGDGLRDRPAAEEGA
jgi:peptide/nickel transport system permease protein